jgi:AcrR family transcriptional regulator
VSPEQAVPLRERKKLRTRQALAETGFAMFAERGYDATTLDALVDAVEVSKRTFFRHFRSKEDVALAPAYQFWDCYLAVLDEDPVRGPALPGLRRTLLTTIDRMEVEWFGQFRIMLGLLDSLPLLNGHSLRHCEEVQRGMVERLGLMSSVEARLLVEIVVAAWRCAIAEWSVDGVPAQLVPAVTRTFDAIPESLRVSV